jgi:hypothetical protein
MAPSREKIHISVKKLLRPVVVFFNKNCRIRLKKEYIKRNLPVRTAFLEELK